jgi:hypothetical protein
VDPNEDQFVARVVFAVNTPTTGTTGHNGPDNDPLPDLMGDDTCSNINHYPSRIDTQNLSRLDAPSETLASHRR